MTRLTLAISIMALLGLAMALGALFHWFWLRLARDQGAEALRLGALTAHLHAAEAAALEARRRAETAEAALATERATTQARITEALAETRAECDAAMEAIGDARREAAEWRAALEARIAETPDA